MILLGIDYGAKKVGLAKAVDSVAVPLTTIINTDRAQVVQQIKSYCQQERADTIVVGIPLSLSGAGNSAVIRDKDLDNKQMQEVLAFVDLLKASTAVPVVLEDERLSTKLAQGLQRGLTKKNGDDAVAAMLILQTYLDRNQGR